MSITMHCQITNTEVFTNVTLVNNMNLPVNSCFEIQTSRTNDRLSPIKFISKGRYEVKCSRLMAN